MMTTRGFSLRTLRLSLSALLATSVLAVSAVLANPDAVAESSILTYVQIEVEIRMLTNASLQERSVLVVGNANQTAASRDISRSFENEILQAYTEHGSTPSAHMAFGTRNSSSIASWLSANPDWQQILDQLSSEFDSLVASFGQDSTR